MSGIVVDASVTLSWCFPDEQTPLSLQVLDRLKAGEDALVPAFSSIEVLNVLLVGERKGRITREQTEAFLDELRALRARFDHTSLEAVCGPVQAICRDHHLTPYDALYVELAMRSGWPLATLDQSQKDAASASASHAYESGCHPRKDIDSVSIGQTQYAVRGATCGRLSMSLRRSRTPTSHADVARRRRA